MSKRATYVLVLLSAALLWMACEESKPPPTPLASPPPAVVPITKPAPDDQARVFTEGTDAQQQHIVAMRTATLRGGDDPSEIIKVLTELFYSEPTSLLQLGAGLDLAHMLTKIKEREAALNVLAELDAVKLEPEYMPALSLKIARQYRAMQEDTLAHAAYARVLTARPDYMFVWQEIAQLHGDGEAQRRYETWRDEQLDALSEADTSGQLAILELLSMVQGDARIEAAFIALQARTTDTRVRAVLEPWLGTYGATAQKSVTTTQGASDEAE